MPATVPSRTVCVSAQCRMEPQINGYGDILQYIDTCIDIDVDGIDTDINDTDRANIDRNDRDKANLEIG